MAPPPTCPRCATPLPGGDWKGACPVCIARVSLRPARGQRLEPATARNAVSPEIRDASAAPRRFGDYELLEEIAHGGMGIVWRARQRSVGRIVALKLMRIAAFSRPEDRERFRAEAAAVAALRHPHIVALHDFGEHEGQPWISLDFIEGPTLARWLRDRPVDPRRAAELLEPIAAAIAYAHARGIIHRDLKPSNILLDPEGRPHLTDFGLAKRLTTPLPGGTPPSRSVTAGALTISGQLLGTPSYAPPEQLAVRSGELGPWSDVYSLGAVLYEMLTGRPPFVAPTLEATLLQVIDTDPVPPRVLRPEVPVDLETICLKCLEKKPARRYVTAGALAADLGRFLRHEPIEARPVGAGGRLVRWSRRKPGWAVAASLGLTLLVAVAVITIGARLERFSLRRTLAARSQAGQPVPVKLQRAWASFSQAGFPIQAAIDGNTLSGGWAIREETDADDLTHPQTAIFITAADEGHPAGSLISFKLTQNGGGQRLIGRFRLALTSVDRDRLADQAGVAGMAPDEWAVLTPRSLATESGAMLTLREDASILATTPMPSVDVYLIRAPTTLSRITGIRLEVLPSPLHPSYGPGMGRPDGNFVLTELEVSISATAALAITRSDPAAAGLTRRMARFVDVEFNPARWTLVTFPPAAARQSATAGMPDEPRGFQRIRQILGPVEVLPVVVSVYLNAQATYDPGAEGAIHRVGFAADTRSFATELTTFGGKIAPALRQGGQIYVAEQFYRPTRDDPDHSQLPSPWKEIDLPGLAATDFYLVTSPQDVDLKRHPDFSPAGAPMVFGYAIGNSHSGPTLVTREVDVDNWSVTLYAPSPATAP